MNTYTKKQKWKLLLFFAAVIIGVVSLWYTNKIVEQISSEERKKVELWAEAVKQSETVTSDDDFRFLFSILQNNRTVPVILTDEAGNIKSTKNLDSAKVNDKSYLLNQLEQMKEANPPIVVTLPNMKKNLIYFKNSTLQTKLFYYPFIQLGVIFLFIIVSYLAFSSSRKAEQNQVWVGMAKETAHQLGTPISSLLAWVELIKMKNADSELVTEVEKDVKRLEIITERFSKIGSPPVLQRKNVISTLSNAVSYVQNRSSNKIHFNLHYINTEEIYIPLNPSLFEWVIENLCKNAIDAMNGTGNISVSVIDQVQVVYVDITDSGKGIPKSKYKTVFNPGYTTKKRGWGLGLSLVKRIIETYHSGKVFIKQSEINEGTTFRIVLKKQT